MVSLAVPKDLEPPFLDNPKGEHFPCELLGSGNQNSHPHPIISTPIRFVGRDVFLQDYRPLVHVMFGGERGNLLRYLTRISVTVFNAAIAGIDFFYTDDSSMEYLQACPSTASVDDSVKIPFIIDGPGGEQLTSCQPDGDFLSASTSHSSYKITSLKVDQTNMVITSTHS
jgi:U3 small nucleolar RNA-associated protein 4